MPIPKAIIIIDIHWERFIRCSEWFRVLYIFSRCHAICQYQKSTRLLSLRYFEIHLWQDTERYEKDKKKYWDTFMTRHRKIWKRSAAILHLGGSYCMMGAAVTLLLHSTNIWHPTITQLYMVFCTFNVWNFISFIWDHISILWNLFL